MASLLPIRNCQQAVAAAQSPDLDDLIEARTFAEQLGERRFQTKEPMPLAFDRHPVLVEGFDEGLANGQCARELIRQGLL